MTSDAVQALVKRAMTGFALDGLICTVKRKRKKIRHRSRLIGGCLAAAGSTP